MVIFKYICKQKIIYVQVRINYHTPITPDKYIELEFTDYKSIFFFSFKSNSGTRAKL